MTTSLKCIEINPSEPPIGSVVWLHGLGADGSDFVPIIPELNLSQTPLRFIFPSAPLRPVSMNNGYVMPAWFDIRSITSDQQIDYPGIEETLEQMQKIIHQENERGIPTDKIIFAGFSQGSVIALLTGLRSQHPLAGIMALSGFLPASDRVLIHANPANKQIPILIAHGTEDIVVPFALGKQTALLLKQHGYNIKFFSYRMGHTVCAEEVADIGQWLKLRFIPSQINLT